MNFENIKPETKKQERTNVIYAERASLRISNEIERIKKIENGEIKKVELTNEEKERVLELEDSLGEKLEKIDAVKIKQNLFYLEYFLTLEGKKDFFDIVGMKIEGESIQELENFILKNRSIFKSIERRALLNLTGRSRIFSEEKTVNSILETMDDNGKIDIDKLNNPPRTKIIINPGEIFEKIRKLRKFKKELRKESSKKKNDNFEIAIAIIQNLYRKKTNTMIAKHAHAGIWANELSEKKDGEINLTEDEINLSDSTFKLAESEEVFSRYDRFMHGAEFEYNKNGLRVQVGHELMACADRVEEKLLNNELKREEKIKEKGLAPEKIDEKSITVREFSEWTEGLLELYDEKSIYPAEEYDPKRKYAAKDNKWQFVARKEHKKSMSTNSKKKIIKSDTENKSVVKVLATLLGHEFTHFIQAKNKEKIKLHLFNEKMGGFRSEIFDEAGAMTIENDITLELFGYENCPKPHYIRAMAKKIEGGTYMECVKTYLESASKSLLIKKQASLINEKEFKKKLKEITRTAVIVTKRLFHGGSTLDSKSVYLTKSKDTVYAEQVIVMEKLRKSGLEKCAFVGGMNLDTLADLMKIGLISLDKIEKPNLDFIRNIWKNIKHEYVSKNN